MRILIVDRVKLFFEIITDVLKDTGIEVSLVDSGAHAQQRLKGEKFDFIASALHLDDTDGIALCQEIRNIPAYKHTPFVLLTSENSPGIQKRAISSGVTDIFAKTNINEFSNFIGRIGQKNRQISGRILYVEDSASQRHLVTAMFVSRGLKVDEFSSGEAAWEAFQQSEYDLVVTDIVLDGDISGVMLVNQIRRMEGDKGDIPILAVTGYDNVARRIGLLHLGVNDYIAKPIVEEELFAKAVNLLALGSHLKSVKLNLLMADHSVSYERNKRADIESERRRLLDIQQTLFAITQNSMASSNLQQQLEAVLELLVAMDWLAISMKGGFYLKNSKGEYILAAQRGLTEQDTDGPVQSIDLSKWNASLTKGGVAFVNGAADMTMEESCYLLPLKNGQNLIGVMVVAVTAEHQSESTSIGFMVSLSEIMGGLISRRMLDETISLNQSELESTRDDFIRKLGQISEFRDSETGLHIIRVSRYAAIVAKHFGADSEYCELLEKSVPMHDVGKIAISDNILKKPGRLTEDEFEIMKGHAKSGAEILDGKGKLLEMAREIALSHHEKWDGSGYPNGHAGEEIPLSGRICAIADVFDALTMDRPYKKAWSDEDASQLIIDSSGTHFDPALVAAFTKALPEIIRFKSLYSDSAINPRAVLRTMPPDHIKEELVSWSEEYSVGIDVIDIHHQYLFDCINSLFSAIKNNEGAGNIEKILKRLEEYTHIHFREEEEMMREMDYPKLEQHIKLHRLFESKIEEFQQELRYNPLLLLCSTVEFLKEWLVEHICKVDSQILKESQAL